MSKRAGQTITPWSWYELINIKLQKDKKMKDMALLDERPKQAETAVEQEQKTPTAAAMDKQLALDTQKPKYVKTTDGFTRMPENPRRVIQAVLDVADELRIHGGQLPPHFGDLDDDITTITDKGEKAFIVMTADMFLDNVNEPQTYAAMSNGGNCTRYIVSESQLLKRGLNNPDLVAEGAKMVRNVARQPHIDRIVAKKGYLPLLGR